MKRKTVEDYYSLKGKVLSGLTVFNPHIHATYIPRQFLQKYADDTRIDSPYSVVYTALRLYRLLDLRNASVRDLKVIEDIFSYTEKQALLEVLNISRWLLQNKGKPSFSRYEMPNNPKVIWDFFNVNPKVFPLSRTSKLHREMCTATRVIPAYALGLGIIKLEDLSKSYKSVCYARYSEMRQCPYTDEFDASMIAAVAKKYFECTHALNQAFLCFGIYCTLNHFSLFGNRYQLSEEVTKAITYAMDCINNTRGYIRSHEAGCLAVIKEIRKALTESQIAAINTTTNPSAANRTSFF